MENLPGRDYSTVMEVLTAYVRENAPQAPGPSSGSSDEASTSNEATSEADEVAEQVASPEPRRPTADIQAILDVLRRAQDRVPEEYRTRLDLYEADLQYANLQRANLYGADLKGANVADHQLADTLSLQDATMPDGQKYENWLIDKESRGRKWRTNKPRSGGPTPGGAIIQTESIIGVLCTTGHEAT
jgi:hypothetical protein